MALQDYSSQELNYNPDANAADKLLTSADITIITTLVEFIHSE